MLSEIELANFLISELFPSSLGSSKKFIHGPGVNLLKIGRPVGQKLLFFILKYVNENTFF